LWDANQLPANNMNNERSLALPKLNLQFLTIHDYLLRNFKLYRLESAYEIRGLNLSIYLYLSIYILSYQYIHT
jgi:intron-binding protein aquarius